MSKKSSPVKSTGEGFLTIIGIVMGVVFAGVIWAWYESGFSDSTQVLATAFWLILAMFIIWYLILVLTKKKYTDMYRKALFFGLGIFIGILAIGIVLGYLGLSASMSVTTVVFAKYAHSEPKLKCGF